VAAAAHGPSSAARGARRAARAWRRGARLPRASSRAHRRRSPSAAARAPPPQTFLDRKEVAERVVQVLKGFEKVDPAKVTASAHFVNDLGLDSLDAVEVCMALEVRRRPRSEKGARDTVRAQRIARLTRAQERGRASDASECVMEH